MLGCAVKCCAVLCCAVLCCAVLCCAMIFYTMLCYAKLCYCVSALGPSTVDLHAADGVLEATDMLHTLRAAHLPAVWPAGGSLCPAGP